MTDSTSLICGPYVLYFIGLAAFILTTFMVFNNRLEFAGICAFMVLFGTSLSIISGKFLPRTVASWFGITPVVTATAATDMPAGTWVAFFYRIINCLTPASFICASIATGLAISVYLGRVNALTKEHTELDFGKQTLRKNSLKKVLVASFIFSWISYIFTATELPGKYIAWSTKLATGAEPTKDGAPVFIRNIASIFAIIAFALSFTALVQAAILSRHFA